MYIYIYVHIHVYTYVYVYIYIFKPLAHASSTAWMVQHMTSMAFCCCIYKYPKEPSKIPHDLEGPSKDTPRTPQGHPRTSQGPPRTCQGQAKLVIS